MTHRQVEGSPESGSRITPNSSSPAASPILAAPASEQGEREAFEAAYRQRFMVPTDTPLRFPDAQKAWEWFQAGRASLRASPPVAQDEREALAHLEHLHQYLKTSPEPFRAWRGHYEAVRAALRASTQPERSAEVGWVLVEGAATENGKAARPYFDAKLSDLPLGRHRLYIASTQPADNKENGNGA